MKYLLISIFTLGLIGCQSPNEAELKAEFVESYNQELMDYFSKYVGRTYVFETEYPDSLGVGGFSGRAFEIESGNLFAGAVGERECNLKVGKQYLHAKTDGGLDLPGGDGTQFNICDNIFQDIKEYDLGKNVDESFTVKGDDVKVHFKTDSEGRIISKEVVGDKLGKVRLMDVKAMGLEDRIGTQLAIN